ncbi:hypothetical protein [Mycobacterium sp. pR1184]|uniref:hypothetical protein n=1 Tax=Mycobacterium sp. pR1184 TaxID=3238981 RepID=UPI00351AF721
MTSDDSHAGAPGRRFSTAALVAAGLAGLIVGAIAAFAITGLVFTIRVQLPPPPYPPPFSQTSGYPAPTSVPPMPPRPPGPPEAITPHALPAPVSP